MRDLDEWLISGPPWVAYNTRKDLLNQDDNDPEVIAHREEMHSHPYVERLLEELSHWPGSVLKNHKSAGHLIHKLTFMADLGLTTEVPQVSAIAERVLEHQSALGPFQVLMNIHPRYGGTGEDQWSWMLCDAPLIIYALAKFGFGKDSRVQAAAEYLAGLIKDNGWPCAVSPELGKFRGPGRKSDPCPFANLIMLKALAQVDGFRDSCVVHHGSEAALTLWEERRERHPYIFYMGTDFCKLKAPFVWYDIVHVVDVLTHFHWLAKDQRLQEMKEIIHSKADDDGRFAPESVWMAWKGWDFGQKKIPSPWLTFIIRRSLNRVR
jgi:hypothetical protein